MPGRRDTEQPLKTWFSMAKGAQWRNHAELKATFGANVDLAHGRHVFDILANKYRLICRIDFQRHGVLVLWIGTHAEYDALNACNGEKLKRL